MTKPTDIKITGADMTEGTFFARENIASFNECTGLVPSAVMTDEESIAYGELYAIHPPQPRD